MSKWEIEYFNEATQTLVPLKADIDRVYEELNGDSYASFYLVNTPENRAIVAEDQVVLVWYDNELVYTGLLSAIDYENSRLKCTLFDEVFHLLDAAEPLSGFYDQAPADVLLDAICEGTGTAAGDGCPTNPVSVVFDCVNRLDAARFLAEALGRDLYSFEMRVYIGIKGAAKALSKFVVSKRGIDRSKKRDRVIVKGVDKDGVNIEGSAGTGTKTKVYREKNPTDIVTLNALAAKWLLELSSESSGAPLSTTINYGYALFAGDSVAISKPEFALTGSFRIVQVTKSKTKVSFQVDRFRAPLDKALADLEKYEDLGIYQPGAQNPWTLSLQGLVGLYHLNEGEGTVATDSSPQDDPVDGTIVNGAWVDGPVTKVLQFNGAGYVDLTNAISFAIVGPMVTDRFSIGGWLDVAEAKSEGNYLIVKPDQFYLRHTNNNALQFIIELADGSQVSLETDAGTAPINSRLFVMAVYDNQTMKVYLNGRLSKTRSQTGNLGGSVEANPVFIGQDLTGAVAECMFWWRALSAQEVLELYFFPLARIIKKSASGTPPPPLLPPAVSGLMGIVSESTTLPKICEVVALTDSTPELIVEVVCTNTNSVAQTIGENVIVTKT
ncbi:MAG: LamG-like jellyroll fold domain-containing protein [Candidatus Bathyarchaeia archaeon]